MIRSKVKTESKTMIEPETTTEHQTATEPQTATESMVDSKPMIELQDVSIGYRDHLVLEDVDLSFPKGQVSVLIGPNGSGKSSLLRTIPGLLNPLKGQILVDGQRNLDYPPKELARLVAFLPQSRRTPAITGRRLVRHGRYPWLSFPRRLSEKDHEQVELAMEITESSELADRELPTLSGGQQQKLYLAMALAQGTQAILMDEPTTWLDIRHQLAVLDLARSLAAEGKAVILVSHDLLQALEVADQLILLNNHKVQYAGPPEVLPQTGLIEEHFGVRMVRVDVGGSCHYVYA